MRHAERAQIVGQHVFGEIGLLLVQVYRHQLETHRRLFLQLQQHVEHRVAVLAAGEADHDLIAVFDHAVVGDGLADLAAQPFAELVAVDRGLARRRLRQRIGQGPFEQGQGEIHPVILPAGDAAQDV